ncbi:hypothetical protein TNCV_1079071 [Trichonephila clavipes]|nr:hypothetical protein TNCV_1079071 [Trichonephila clavipes]
MSTNDRCSGLSDSEGIQRLVWPARSPDLNPIENVWDALGGKLLAEDIIRQTRTPLIRALTEEWDKLPQQLLDNVVQCMVRRVNVASHTTVDLYSTGIFL